MNTVCRRLLNESEIDAAAKLESEALSTAWNSSQIASLPDYALYLGAFSGDILCGIISVYFIADEGQIMNLAVAPEYRKTGVAGALLQSVFEHGKKINCFNITLEVAEDNFSAIALYKKHGFAIAGKRKGFYKDTDGLIMEKKL